MYTGAPPAGTSAEHPMRAPGLYAHAYGSHVPALQRYTPPPMKWLPSAPPRTTKRWFTPSYAPHPASRMDGPDTTSAVYDQSAAPGSHVHTPPAGICWPAVLERSAPPQRRATP